MAPWTSHTSTTWSLLQRLRSARSVLAVVSGMLFTGLVLWVVEALGGPTEVFAELGWGAPLLSVPTHLVVTVTPVGEFVPWGVANGILYGFTFGAAANWMAWMGAAVVQYAFGWYTARDAALQRHFRRLPNWLARFPVDHPFVLITTRWLPMGGTVINVAAGACNVGFQRFLWCAAIGYLPQSAGVAAAGTGLWHLLL